MSGKINKVTVKILGENYSLKSDSDLEHVMQVAALVDERMKKIAKSNSSLTPNRVAILAALTLAEELLKVDKNYKELVKMVEEEK